MSGQATCHGIIIPALLQLTNYRITFCLTQVLFHTAGIVILTLLINATTIKYLLDTLGLSDISNARRLTMVTAIRRINEAKAKAMRLLKSDRFLADAHWDVVDRKTVIDNPFDSEDEEENNVCFPVCL